MLKKLFIFFFLFSVNISIVEAAKVYQCNNKISENLIKTINNSQPKIIKINLNNYRKWQKNNIRIITERSRIIPSKYKTRFNAKIEVVFEGNLKCKFRARIRQHGDFKDHIYLKDGAIIQSLDVHLENGHINGITKFKLLIPHTRGKANHEVFITTLLKELNFIAPRTSLVEVKVNEKNTIMLFQEKAAKELLEYNLRREGPIFEGDERYMFPAVAKFPDNQLSNISIGMLEELERTVKVQLAKQTNTKWNSKTNNHSRISLHSLTLLNRAFLLYSNQFKNSKNNFHYFNYNLDNKLLGVNEPKHILKLDIFNLIVFASNGWHGMVPHNRKFYWNSLENYFEPIYYDGNVNLDQEPLYINLPFSDYLLPAILESEKMIEQVELDSFKKKLNVRGLNYNKSQVIDKLNILKANLKKLTFKISSLDQDLIDNNKNQKITDEMWKNYINLILSFNSKINIILKDPNNENFLVCRNKPLECSSKFFTNSEIENLLESELNLNESPYQYIGEYAGVNFLNKVRQSSYKKIKFQDSNFYFDEDIKFVFDSEKNQFNIFQNKPGARAFFYKGMLKDLDINFHGYAEEFTYELANYPVDQRGLTGCLSLIHLKVSNLKINSNNSSCEDTVNLINVVGTFREINIKDSFSDGLDVDFSELEIDRINIFSSRNDCADFSAGKYKLNELNLTNCGDKGLSVGEKSVLQLNEIVVENSDIGIASKDSSITKMESAYLKNLKTCVSAYNKKQEFYGGLLEAKNLKCKNYVYKTNIDAHSKIIIEN